MPHYINQVYTALAGGRFDNAAMLATFEPILEGFDIEEEQRKRLLDFVRFQLVGTRSRQSVVPDWTALDSFATRAHFFERGAEELLDRLAEQIAPAAEMAGVRFDAILAT